MKDTAYFFPHDYGARNDPKLQNVFMEYGCEGLGIYWCIIEMMYEQGGTLPLLNCKSIAFALHIECKVVESIINDFDLFNNDGENFWSESVNKRLNNRADIIEKRRQAAIISWESRRAMQVQSKCSASVMVCNANKRKEKKRKENDNTPPTNVVGGVIITSRTNVLEDNNNVAVRDSNNIISLKDNTHTREDESTESPKTVSSWKKDYQVYLDGLRSSYRSLINDKNWIAEQERFNPFINVILTLEKACTNFWATEAGWKHKIRQRTADINWKSTLTNSLSQPQNKVYKDEPQRATTSKSTSRVSADYKASILEKLGVTGSAEEMPIFDDGGSVRP